MKKIEVVGSYIESQKKLFDELTSYITEDVNILLTNGNMASILQDSVSFELVDSIKESMMSDDGKPKIYKLGNFGKTQVLVDPYMRWDDNRIFLKCDENIVDEIIVDDKNGVLI